MTTYSRVTPDNIADLPAEHVFVFGSNLAGVHGAGAALLAARRFGAVRGKGVGMSGRSYALPTKDASLRTLPLSEIQRHVAEFLKVARDMPHVRFLVTRVGCGLAGYSPGEVAPLFFRVGHIPANVSLPAEFWSAAEAAPQEA